MQIKYCACTFGGDRLHGYIHTYVDHHLHTKLHKNQSLFIFVGKVKVYLVVEGIVFCEEKHTSIQTA